MAEQIYHIKRAMEKVKNKQRDNEKRDNEKRDNEKKNITIQITPEKNKLSKDLNM